MSEDEKNIEDIENELEEMTPTESDEVQGHSDYKMPEENGETAKYHLSGMYRNWFLDYASYVILERAVPHINDGLKPVQRRILHTMKKMDDGRYCKVANIVGQAMQFHPHGDASIYGALVQLGQKDLLIDCQGSWGNILTGDEAAAPRYIEARLSKFALDTLYSPKITEWKLSYDGRNREPVTLPVKFPLLLAQGVEGLAVGLSSKVLPHNFNEIIAASIAHLRGEDFVLYPDFPTGGSVDVSHYNDGARGGSVKVRAKISKLDSKTLVISEIPFGTTVPKLIASIVTANEKGKIKIKKIDDNTAAQAEILIHLLPGTSSDKTIDALYAFTECESRISPNCCVVQNQKPIFTTVSQVLRDSTEQTKKYLGQELQIQRAELLEQLFYVSLERIFIENRIYKEKKFEESTSQDEAIKVIDSKLEPFKKDFIREVTREDLLKLLEIKMARITRFSSAKADENIASIKSKIEDVDYNLAHLVDYTIQWFEYLGEKYGADKKRLTEIRNFETIMATKVVEANEKLYINREEGFIGTGLKKDEFVCNCSDIDDVIVFFKNGKYKVVKVAEKIYVGKNVIHLDVFKKNDKRTVYNVVYRDGKSTIYYIKRFAVTGVTRDKEYDITQGKEGTKVMYFSANPNGEAEVIKITLKPKLRIKNLTVEKDFGEIAIKGRQSMGNILTKNEIFKIALKQRGNSTLGGRKVWFDHDVLRLNYDGRGDYLGEFASTDLVCVIYQNGEYCTCSFDSNNHFNNNILRIEKFNPAKVWSLALVDADQKNCYYIKRFTLEANAKMANILGDNPKSELKLLSDNVYPLFKVEYGGDDSFRDSQTIDVEEFIGVKSFKAKGKRVSTWTVAQITELPPVRFPEETEEEQPPVPEIEDEEEVKMEQRRQEILAPKTEQNNDLDEPTDDEPTSGNEQLSLF